MSMKTLSIPRNAVAFNIAGDCLEPYFRDGWQVFVSQRDDGDIAMGIPVVVETDGDLNGMSKFLVKFWHGIRGDDVVLGFMDDGAGRAGTLRIPRRTVKSVWEVTGAWFNGRPPVQSRQPGAFAIPVMTAKDLWNLPRRAPSSNPPSLADVVAMANAGERGA